MILAVLVVLALASHSAGSRLSGGGHHYAQISLPARDTRFGAARGRSRRRAVTSCVSLRRPSRMTLEQRRGLIEL